MGKFNEKAIIFQREPFTTDLKISGSDGSIKFDVPILKNGDNTAIRFDTHIQGIAHFKFINTANDHISLLENSR